MGLIIYLCLSVLALSTCPVLAQEYGFEEEPITLTCGYTGTPEASVIFWQYNERPSPFVSLNLQTSRENIADDWFKDRVDMNAMNGDLTISTLKRNDSGTYKCNTLEGGAPNIKSTQQIDVYVRPEARMLCAKDPESKPGEPCRSFEDDEIASGACQVTSKPRPIVGWLEDTTKCGDGFKPDSSCMVDSDGVWTCTSVLLNVCPGTYTCGVTYLEKVVPITDSKKFTKAGSGPSKGSLVGIVCGVAIVALIILIVFLVWVIRRHRQKQQQLELEKSNAEGKPLQDGEAGDVETGEGENQVPDDSRNGNDAEHDNKMVVAKKRGMPPKQLTVRAEKYFDVVKDPNFKGKARYRSVDPDGKEVFMEFDRMPASTQPAIQEEPSSPTIEEV